MFLSRLPACSLACMIINLNYFFFQHSSSLDFLLLHLLWCLTSIFKQSLFLRTILIASCLVISFFLHSQRRFPYVTWAWTTGFSRFPRFPSLLCNRRLIVQLQTRENVFVINNKMKKNNTFDFQSESFRNNLFHYVCFYCSWKQMEEKKALIRFINIDAIWVRKRSHIIKRFLLAVF